MPGAPPSESTTSPESSANAGRPDAFAAASALRRAFAAKVVPVSSGSGRFRSLADTASTPCNPSSSRISASLPLLCVAMTRRPVICRCMDSVPVIPGPAEGRSPESITAIRSMSLRRSQILFFRVYGSRVSLRSPGMTTELHHGELLQIHELADSLAGKADQSAKLLLPERDLLGRRLHLDQVARAGHDEIRIRVGLRIFRIVEIAHRDPVAHTAGHRRHVIAQRVP